jgi:hypothetical protein
MQLEASIEANSPRFKGFTMVWEGTKEMSLKVI